MSDAGYGGQAMTGALPGPFEVGAPPPGFAASLETSPPLPEGCAFRDESAPLNRTGSVGPPRRR